MFDAVATALPAVQILQLAHLAKLVFTFQVVVATPASITAYHAAQIIQPLIHYAKHASKAMFTTQQPKPVLNVLPDALSVTPKKSMSVLNVGRDLKREESTTRSPVQNVPITAEFVTTVFVNFAEILSDC